MKSFSLRGWLPLVVLLSLLAGCRSEQVAFDFGPQPGQQRPALAAAQVVAPPVALADSTAQLPAAPQTARQLPPQHIVAAPAQPEAAGKTTRHVLQSLAPLHRLRPTATAARPAENGLENIFFFALGVVLLVLAGLAWAVAAIFSIGFWAALGYVAAGIVVLLLLRSLFKKKHHS